MSGRCWASPGRCDHGLPSDQGGRAATNTALPSLNLAGEFLSGVRLSSVHIVQALLDLVEDMEPVKDLIQRHVIGQALDGINGSLIG